jgi:hypothetical protein
MRRRQLLLLFVCANAQFALPTLALAKDGEDDDSNHDSDDDSDDDDGSDDNGGDDDGGDDGGGADDGGGDGSSGNGRDDDRDDHDRAYEAVSSGQAVPLRQVLDSFAKEFGGTVVDVKLVAGDTLRYRIRFVDGAGRVRQIYYDATNGKLLR